MKYIFRVLILIIPLFCLQNNSRLLAHTITTANIGTVKVDDLTDAQLQDLMKQAQATGLSDVQLRNLAI